MEADIDDPDDITADVVDMRKQQGGRRGGKSAKRGKNSGPGCVVTIPLTRSFGWDRAALFEQHDVQELMRQLLDGLKSRLRDTPLSRSIDALFVCKTVARTRVTEAPWAGKVSVRPRAEELMDISLVVEGHERDGLYGSLREYTAESILDGDNKYELELPPAAVEEGHPKKVKVAATRRTLIRVLPPVLHLQLKRFTYDKDSGEKAKVNSRFAFAECIDLAEFVDSGEGLADMAHLPGPTACAAAGPSFPLHVLDTAAACNRVAKPAVGGPSSSSSSTTTSSSSSSTVGDAASTTSHRKATSNADSRSSSRYLLHSVLVHSGSIAGGHYYAFVRPRLGLDASTMPREHEIPRPSPQPRRAPAAHMPDEALATDDGGADGGGAAKKAFTAQHLAAVRRWIGTVDADVDSDAPVAHARRSTRSKATQALQEFVRADEPDFPNELWKRYGDSEAALAAEDDTATATAAHDSSIPRDGGSGVPEGVDLKEHRGWFKFNDEEVTPSCTGQAVVDNYGGERGSTASAYFLVYVREDAIPDVMFDVCSVPLAALQDCVMPTRTPAAADAFVTSFIPAADAVAARSTVVMRDSSTVLPTEAVRESQPGDRTRPICEVIDVISSDDDESATAQCSSPNPEMELFVQPASATASKRSRSQAMSSVPDASKRVRAVLPARSIDGDNEEYEDVKMVDEWAFCEPDSQPCVSVTAPTAHQRKAVPVVASGTDDAAMRKQAGHSFLDVSVPMPEAVFHRIRAQHAAEMAARDAEKKQRVELEARKPVTLYVVTDAHLAAAPWPPARIAPLEMNPWEVEDAADGGHRPAHALPLEHAFRVRVALGATIDSVYQSVAQQLGLPRHSFVLFDTAVDAGNHSVLQVNVPLGFDPSTNTYAPRLLSNSGGAENPTSGATGLATSTTSTTVLDRLRAWGSRDMSVLWDTLLLTHSPGYGAPAVGLLRTFNAMDASRPQHTLRRRGEIPPAVEPAAAVHTDATAILNLMPRAPWDVAMAAAGAGARVSGGPLEQYRRLEAAATVDGRAVAALRQSAHEGSALRSSEKEPAWRLWTTSGNDEPTANVTHHAVLYLLFLPTHEAVSALQVLCSAPRATESPRSTSGIVVDHSAATSCYSASDQHELLTPRGASPSVTSGESNVARPHPYLVALAPDILRHLVNFSAWSFVLAARMFEQHNQSTDAGKKKRGASARHKSSTHELADDDGTSPWTEDGEMLEPLRSTASTWASLARHDALHMRGGLCAEIDAAIAMADAAVLAPTALARVLEPLLQLPALPTNRHPLQLMRGEKDDAEVFFLVHVYRFDSSGGVATAPTHLPPLPIATPSSSCGPVSLVGSVPVPGRSTWGNVVRMLEQWLGATSLDPEFLLRMNATPSGCAMRDQAGPLRLWMSTTDGTAAEVVDLDAAVNDAVTGATGSRSQLQPLVDGTVLWLALDDSEIGACWRQQCVTPSITAETVAAARTRRSRSATTKWSSPTQLAVLDDDQSAVALLQSGNETSDSEYNDRKTQQKMSGRTTKRIKPPSSAQLHDLPAPSAAKRLVLSAGGRGITVFPCDVRPFVTMVRSRVRVRLHMRDSLLVLHGATVSRGGLPQFALANEAVTSRTANGARAKVRATAVANVVTATDDPTASGVVLPALCGDSLRVLHVAAAVTDVVSAAPLGAPYESSPFALQWQNVEDGLSRAPPLPDAWFSLAEEVYVAARRQVRLALDTAMANRICEDETISPKVSTRGHGTNIDARDVCADSAFDKQCASPWHVLKLFVDGLPATVGANNAASLSAQRPRDVTPSSVDVLALALATLPPIPPVVLPLDLMLLPHAKCTAIATLASEELRCRAAVLAHGLALRAVQSLLLDCIDSAAASEPRNPSDVHTCVILPSVDSSSVTNRRREKRDASGADKMHVGTDEAGALSNGARDAARALSAILIAGPAPLPEVDVVDADDVGRLCDRLLLYKTKTASPWAVDALTCIGSASDELAAIAERSRGALDVVGDLGPTASEEGTSSSNSSTPLAPWVWAPYNLAFELLPRGQPIARAADYVTLQVMWAGLDVLVKHDVGWLSSRSDSGVDPSFARTFALTVRRSASATEVAALITARVGIMDSARCGRQPLLPAIRMTLYRASAFARPSNSRTGAGSGDASFSAAVTAPLCVLSPLDTVTSAVKLAEEAVQACSVDEGRPHMLQTIEASLFDARAAGISAASRNSSGVLPTYTTSHIVLLAEAVPSWEPPFPLTVRPVVTDTAGQGSTRRAESSRVNEAMLWFGASTGSIDSLRTGAAYALDRLLSRPVGQPKGALRPSGGDPAQAAAAAAVAWVLVGFAADVQSRAQQIDSATRAAPRATSVSAYFTKKAPLSTESSGKAPTTPGDAKRPAAGAATVAVASAILIGRCVLVPVLPSDRIEDVALYAAARLGALPDGLPANVDDAKAFKHSLVESLVLPASSLQPESKRGAELPTGERPPVASAAANSAMSSMGAGLAQRFSPAMQMSDLLAPWPASSRPEMPHTSVGELDAPYDNDDASAKDDKDTDTDVEVTTAPMTFIAIEGDGIDAQHRATATASIAPAATPATNSTNFVDADDDLATGTVGDDNDTVIAETDEPQSDTQVDMRVLEHAVEPAVMAESSEAVVNAAWADVPQTAAAVRAASVLQLQNALVVRANDSDVIVIDDDDAGGNRGSAETLPPVPACSTQPSSSNTMAVFDAPKPTRGAMRSIAPNVLTRDGGGTITMSNFPIGTVLRSILPKRPTRGRKQVEASLKQEALSSVDAQQPKLVFPAAPSGKQAKKKSAAAIDVEDASDDSGKSQKQAALHCSWWNHTAPRLLPASALDIAAVAGDTVNDRRAAAGGNDKASLRLLGLPYVPPPAAPLPAVESASTRRADGDGLARHDVTHSTLLLAGSVESSAIGQSAAGTASLLSRGGSTRNTIPEARSALMSLQGGSRPHVATTQPVASGGSESSSTATRLVLNIPTLLLRAPAPRHDGPSTTVESHSASSPAPQPLQQLLWAGVCSLTGGVLLATEFGAAIATPSVGIGSSSSVPAIRFDDLPGAPEVESAGSDAADGAYRHLVQHVDRVWQGGGGVNAPGADAARRAPGYASLVPAAGLLKAQLLARLAAAAKAKNEAAAISSDDSDSVLDAGDVALAVPEKPTPSKPKETGLKISF